MKLTTIIIKNSIKNNLRSKAMTAGFIAISVMLVAGLTALFCIMLINPVVRSESPDIEKMKLYLGLVTYVSGIICLGINLNVFAFGSMAREKSRGNIESLLATPLNINNIWIAKSIAVFIPGLVLAVVLGILVNISINLIYFLPLTGFIFSPWLFLSSFLAASLIYLCLGLLTHIIGLSGKTSTSNIIAQIFLPVFLALMINIILHDVLNPNSWTFMIANLLIAFLLSIVTVFLRPRLNTEKVVLSE
jgi:ABC-type Na+ efflux pump permease subunit